MIASLLASARAPSEEDVVARTRALVASVADDVRRWSFRYLGPRSDLDDAVQEALIAVFRSVPAFRGRSSFRTYAYRVAMREVVRFGKRAKRDPLPPPAFTLVEVASAPEQEQRVLDRAMMASLYRCLESLTSERRRALVLVAVEGLSIEEAAELEGCSVRAMRARLTRGRATLVVRAQRDVLLAAWFEGAR